ncbi:MAG TPA: penicillin-binding protein 2 [Patescibacteria group bacterium]|nr:penicillin-binding protein 2 [Patescibacteria group bacterium]
MKWRYQVILFLFLCSFFLILARLFYWQIVQGDQLTQQAQSQYGSLVTVEPKRGDIQTSDGFPIVTNRLSYLVFANPKEISDVGHVAEELSSLLNIEVASLSGRLSYDGYWVSLKSGIDTKTKDAINELKIPGVGFEENYARFYPEASMAASLVGFVGKDTVGNSKGYFGLEGYYDRQLKGRSGQAVEVHDALGRPILSQVSGNGQAQDGRTLVLTIDRSLQFLAEAKLKEGVKQFGADAGLIAIMDPKTGGILAMANYPSFDENTFWEYDTSLYKNPMISNLYEPGSTIKPIVMAGAFENNLLKPDSTCPICSKPVQVGDYAIHTWNDEYFPNITMQDVIRHSDNTGMVYVSEKMGLKRMLSNFENFGLTDTTNVDLQGEAVSTILDRKTWYPIDVATSAFGQGISVTPMELLDAFSALANNGVRMQPHVVDKIITADGQTIPIAPKKLSQPISAKTAKVMTEILVYTVDKGEASFARLKGYRIAGKTGTASIPVAGHYDPTQTIASFIGYAPADDPKFVMLVVYDKPSASIYGAETAAPTFFDVAKHILSYYGISATSSE